MRKILFSVAVLCGAALYGSAPVLAQQSDPQAGAVVKRYEEVTGLNKVNASMMQTVVMDMEALVGNQHVEMKTTVEFPYNYRIEARIQEEEVLIVINEQGAWMSVPGYGIMPLPDEMLESLRKQTNVSQNYKWDERDYTFQLVDQMQQGAKTLQGVRFTPKTKIDQIEYFTVWFDQATGYADYMITTVSDELSSQTTAVRVDMSDYKTFGEIQIPSEYKMSVDNVVVGTIKLHDVKHGIPVSAEWFAEPK